MDDAGTADEMFFVSRSLSILNMSIEMEEEGFVVPRREGMQYVCAVSEEAGAVVKLEVKRGRVIARTESGMTMILPISRS